MMSGSTVAGASSRSPIDQGGPRTIVVGAVVVVVCVVELLVMGRAVWPLVIALGLSYALWVRQPAGRVTRALLTAYGGAVLVQCAHLVEELQTGFYAAFPPVFGGDAWSARRFLLFNLAWLVIFTVGASGLLRSRRPAWLVAYFLAIGGGIGNGLGHLALVGQRGGYFPGAYTAVMALVVGSVLLWNLIQWRETSPRTRLTTKMRAR